MLATSLTRESLRSHSSTKPIAIPPSRDRLQTRIRQSRGLEESFRKEPRQQLTVHPRSPDAFSKQYDECYAMAHKDSNDEHTTDPAEPRIAATSPVSFRNNSGSSSGAVATPLGTRRTSRPDRNSAYATGTSILISPPTATPSTTTITPIARLMFRSRTDASSTTQTAPPRSICTVSYNGVAQCPRIRHTITPPHKAPRLPRLHQSCRNTQYSSTNTLQRLKRGIYQARSTWTRHPLFQWASPYIAVRSCRAGARGQRVPP
ncbi:hypothetical protein JB92DRAFT_1919195 [Gautieria morchelliformis]|nr:hypothetical protein JB92DRAFT_1919195 [Gautieria morchelliformis]